MLSGIVSPANLFFEKVSVMKQINFKEMAHVCEIEVL